VPYPLDETGEPKSPLVDMIIARNRAGYNNIIGVIGPTGSGKSYTGLRLAWRCELAASLEFSVDQVVFSGAELLARILTLDSGKFIVFDDAGTGKAWGSKQSMHVHNKILGWVMQSFRFKQINVIITLPDFNMLDNQGRALCHFVVSQWGHDKEVGNATAYRVIHNAFGGNTTLEPIQDLRVFMPPDKVVTPYLKHKSKFMHQFYRECLRDLKKYT